MLTLLFWDLDGKDLTASLVSLVFAHRPDVVVLAENGAPEGPLAALNGASAAPMQAASPPSACGRVLMFCRSALGPMPVEGDRPAGTCYYPAGGPVWYYWNVFDQVLLRPALLPHYWENSVRVLTSDGRSSLLGPDGLPDRRKASDHLPLLVRLYPVRR